MAHSISSRYNVWQSISSLAKNSRRHHFLFSLFFPTLFFTYHQSRSQTISKCEIICNQLCKRLSLEASRLFQNSRVFETTSSEVIGQGQSLSNFRRQVLIIGFLCSGMGGGGGGGGGVFLLLRFPPVRNECQSGKERGRKHLPVLIYLWCLEVALLIREGDEREC